MGFFDRFRRRSAGGPAAVRARLEGAMAKRRLRGWNPPLENINALVASGGPRLLARSRELVVTNGYAANACEAFAANLVGDGIKPSSLIGDAGLRDQVQRLWLAWTDEADADGLTDFYGLQAMVAREMFVAGECFVRLRPRRAEDGLLVPVQLQLLQSEMLPFEKTETAANGNRIRCGIEFDGIGRRVAYHFRRRHPGDSTDQGADIPETVRVPAADVLHIYRPIDAGQIRGLPHIAPAMVRLFLLDQYDDAELDRKKTAAMFAGFITKTAPEEPMMGEAEADLDGAAIASLEPGTMQVLLPGALAGLAGGARHLDLAPGGGTLADVLDALAAEHPVLCRRIRDETGRVRRFVNVYVDGEDVRFTGGLDAPVADGAEVQVLPSVAGG